MPDAMVALLNIAGALCSMPQSLPDAHYQNAGSISAASEPKCTILWRRGGDIAA